MTAPWPQDRGVFCSAIGSAAPSRPSARTAAAPSGWMACRGPSSPYRAFPRTLTPMPRETTMSVHYTRRGYGMRPPARGRSRILVVNLAGVLGILFFLGLVVYGVYLVLHGG